MSRHLLLAVLLASAACLAAGAPCEMGRRVDGPPAAAPPGGPAAAAPALGCGPVGPVVGGFRVAHPRCIAPWFLRLQPRMA